MSLLGTAIGVFAPKLSGVIKSYVAQAIGASFLAGYLNGSDAMMIGSALASLVMAFITYAANRSESLGAKLASRPGWSVIPPTPDKADAVIALAPSAADSVAAPGTAYDRAAGNMTP